MNDTADVVVAGLGAMGSAALYQLAKRGIKAIGVDQFAPPHDLGSSHGESRIVRQVTGQAIEYTPLALRAYNIWRELEQETRQKLMTITGGLIVEADDSVSAQKQSRYFPVLKEAAEKYHVRHEILPLSELNKRFPQFCFRGNEQGYYEPDAGILRPEACVDAHLSLAKRHGAKVKLNERVLNFSSNSSGVTVITDKGKYSTQKLILSTGSWIPNFIPHYKKLFKVCRQVMHWFDIPGDITPYLPGNMPVFIFELADGSGPYGFPAIDGPRGGLKLAEENYTVTTSPDQVKRDVSEQEIRDTYKKFVQPYLPGLSSRCIKSTTCLYTLTPGYFFIIDLLPEDSNIVVASPCSGHGFKYSAAIGEALAELAVGKKTTVDISAFGFSRYKADLL